MGPNPVAAMKKRMQRMRRKVKPKGMTGTKVGASPKRLKLKGMKEMSGFGKTKGY